MPRSVRLYTAAQLDEVATLVNTLAEHSALAPVDQDRVRAFQADLRQTVREDRRRNAGTVRLRTASSRPA